MDILLSDEQIEILIKCPKKITQHPTKEDKEDRQFHRNEMRLISTDEQYSFQVYFRRHAVFIESFSVGLVYTPNELKGSLTLLRCNGQHGSTRYKHHNSCHIHRVTENILQKNLKSERDITITNAYSSYEQTVLFFSKECNIIGPCEYIDNLKQITVMSLCSQNQT